MKVEDRLRLFDWLRDDVSIPLWVDIEAIKPYWTTLVMGRNPRFASLDATALPLYAEEHVALAYAVIRRAASGDPNEMLMVLARLARATKEHNLALLSECLRSEDPYRRILAVGAIAAIGGMDAHAILRSHIGSDKAPESFYETIAGLWHISSEIANNGVSVTDWIRFVSDHGSTLLSALAPENVTVAVSYSEGRLAYEIHVAQLTDQAMTERTIRLLHRSIGDLGRVPYVSSQNEAWDLMKNVPDNHVIVVVEREV